MPRIILPSSYISKETPLKISGQEAHYLINVLRLSEGETFEILEDKGQLYRTEIVSIKKGEVLVKVFEQYQLKTESSLHLILVQSILKGEKMDFVIQKATELGVKEIYPAISSRTIVRETRRYKRWLKIAHEAVRQSGRREPPLIHLPVDFKEFIERLKASQGFIFYEGAGSGLKGLQIDRPFSSLYCVIGPEGGFTKDEVDLSAAKGLLPLSLGPRILRAETATITALSILQFIFGDLG